jgi:hypothetical protein
MISLQWDGWHNEPRAGEGDRTRQDCASGDTGAIWRSDGDAGQCWGERTRDVRRKPIMCFNKDIQYIEILKEN